MDALLGISAYQPPPNVLGPALDSRAVEQIREALGGQIQPVATSQVRWYLADLEAAEYAADYGDMRQIARLMRAARRDGVVSGVLSTRTGGLVRLPKRFRGDEEIVSALKAGTSGLEVEPRAVFDEMFPPQELALLAGDGELCGVGVGELVPVKGRKYPVLVRLDPEFLVYRWADNTWYYRSVAGLLPITPGDGKWILHTPGGRIAPWQHGLWKAIGRAYIRKEHAALNKDNWESKLANPARVAKAPAAATDEQIEGWFRKVAAWGINTVFAMKPGYDVALLESNGRGWESFIKTIADQNNEIIIALAGQTVTTDGGTGFANADIHKSIRADLIKKTADDLAFTINTQGIPAFVVNGWGIDALKRSPVVEWDVTPPKDLAAQAQSLVSIANAITTLTEALAASGRQPDVASICSMYGVPILGDRDGDGNADTGGTVTPLRRVA